MQREDFPGSPLGLHRVIEPAGALPQAAWRLDPSPGLFASYSDVQFRAPVLGGDVIKTTATVTRAGRRSRDMAFEARVVCRAAPERGPSASDVLDEPVVVVTARGTVVVAAPAG